MAELLDADGNPVRRPRPDTEIMAQVRHVLGSVNRDKPHPQAVMGIQVETFLWMAKHVFGYALVRAAMQPPGERAYDGFPEALAQMPEALQAVVRRVAHMYDGAHPDPVAVRPATTPFGLQFCSCGPAPDVDPDCPVGKIVGNHPVGASALAGYTPDDAGKT